MNHETRYKIKSSDGKPVIVKRETELTTKAARPFDDYDGLRVEILGVPFGGPEMGRDTDGETFTSDTNIGMAIGDTRPITYYHGFGPDDPNEMQEHPAVIGMARLTRKDSAGYWFDGVLDESEPLAHRITAEALAADGVRASSGAAGHTVRKQRNGIIDDWFVAELAIFDTNDWRLPANDFAVVMAKSVKADVVLSEAVVEAVKSNTPAVDETEAEQIEPQINQNLEISDEITEVFTMDEELKGEITALVTDAVKAAMPAVGDPAPAGGVFTGAPAVLTTGLGDSEIKGFYHFLRTGKENSGLVPTKASNATDMNIGTPADGGYAVPTGLVNQIVARRDEDMLATKLGVRNIPGKGTTVNVPLDGEDDGEFVSTGEVSQFDEDAPVVGIKAFTLAKYTKRTLLSYELLRDEDARLEAFLVDFVGRGMAKTHNSLLLTQVGSAGTSLKTFASATTYAIGELEAMVYGANMAAYLGESSTGWVTTGPNYSKIVSLAGSNRIYAETPQGVMGRSLLGFPVAFSNKVATAAASAKSIYFGNWNYVGLREGDGFSVLRDPYTRADYGQVRMLWYFDAVYGVLQAEAIGYGVHPTA